MARSHTTLDLDWELWRDAAELRRRRHDSSRSTRVLLGFYSSAAGVNATMLAAIAA
jgi:hypothetical protein